MARWLASCCITTASRPSQGKRNAESTESRSPTANEVSERHERERSTCHKTYMLTLKSISWEYHGHSTHATSWCGYSGACQKGKKRQISPCTQAESSQRSALRLRERWYALVPVPLRNLLWLWQQPVRAKLRWALSRSLMFKKLSSALPYCFYWYASGKARNARSETSLQVRSSAQDLDQWQRWVLSVVNMPERLLGYEPLPTGIQSKYPSAWKNMQRWRYSLLLLHQEHGGDGVHLCWSRRSHRSTTHDQHWTFDKSPSLMGRWPADE